MPGPSPAPLPAVSALRLVRLPSPGSDEAVRLVVMQSGDPLPDPITRAFTLRGGAGAIRGQHAHRRCAQFMVCANGEIEIVCDDGDATARFTLAQPDEALPVPPGLWTEVRFRKDASVLLVLCDRPYEADDYIRDYEAFRTYRRAALQGESR